MYKLYYKSGSCSLAIHALLNELGQQVELIEAATTANYKEKINPTGGVPVLDDNGLIVSEGAAIAIYLLEKHKSAMLPASGAERANALQWLMFANASVHPAYSKIFFSSSAIKNEEGKAQALQAAADGVSKLWAIVEAQLAKTQFVCGNNPSAADFMLTIYANWGVSYFSQLDIKLGANTKRLFKDIISLPAYQKALAAENVEYKAAA